MRDYNSKEGIQEYLKDGLAGLNQLAGDRMEAGYTRKERLREFCILGRWHTDTCGNFGCIVKGAPADLIYCEDVMTQEEMNKLTPSITIEHGGPTHLPEARMRCPHCGEGWDAHNAHRVYCTSADMALASTEYAGLTPLEAGKLISRGFTDRKIFVHDHITNSRLIDLTPEKSMWSDDMYPKNKHGSKEVNLKTYLLEEGDFLHATARIYYHDTCYKLKQQEEERRQFEKALRSAGFDNFEMMPFPNQYWPGDPVYAAPWYYVSTEIGRLRIGWRKRVIEICWPDMKLAKQPDFSAEDVTKEATLIHAWGYDKATEYLKKLRECA